MKTTLFILGTLIILSGCSTVQKENNDWTELNLKGKVKSL